MPTTITPRTAARSSYQLVLLPPPVIVRSLLTLLTTAYPPESIVSQTPTPYITLFHPVPLAAFEDIALLVHEWGAFDLTILGTFTVTRSQAGDQISCPVISQDCIYISHILSRFIDPIPQYATEFLPQCFLGMIQHGYGLSLMSPTYKPLIFRADTLYLMDLSSQTIAQSFSLLPLH